MGHDAFAKNHDPYYDIPLNDELPKPVIDLPISGEVATDEDGEFRLASQPPPVSGRGRKK
jgi:hypothetical protein